MTSDTRIMIFARSPVLGQVKTRLAKHIGNEAAVHAYCEMLQCCVENAVLALPNSVSIYATPDPTHPFFGKLRQAHGVELESQSEGSLGDRMASALDRELSRSRSAMVMGGDVPSIEADDIRAAAASLRGGDDVVLVPTEDGGYGMIGVRRPHAELFEGIDWGTSSVFDQTVRKITTLGLRWSAGPMRWDIDEPDDLLRWQTASKERRGDGG